MACSPAVGGNYHQHALPIKCRPYTLGVNVLGNVGMKSPLSEFGSATPTSPTLIFCGIRRSHSVMCGANHSAAYFHCAWEVLGVMVPPKNKFIRLHRPWRCSQDSGGDPCFLEMHCPLSLHLFCFYVYSYCLYWCLSF